MNGPYFGPCTTIRQYRDRDRDLQDKDDAELEAARQEADSFSFGCRHKFTNTRLEFAMSTDDIYHALMAGQKSADALLTWQKPKSAYDEVRESQRIIERGIAAYNLLSTQRRDGRKHIDPPEDFVHDACYCRHTKPPCGFCESHGDDK